MFQSRGKGYLLAAGIRNETQPPLDLLFSRTLQGYLALTLISSTSNSSVLFGGMRFPAPLSP